jgi:hypothetical protein
MMNRAISGIAAAAPVLLPGAEAMAHGFAGDRFFPATILTDDPFVADETSLPTATRAPSANDGTEQYSIQFDIVRSASCLIWA